MFSPDIDLTKLTDAERAELDHLLRLVGNDPHLSWVSGMTSYQHEAWNALFIERAPMVLLQWGRGTGKTRFGAQAVREFCDRYSGCEIILAAPTYADIRDVMVNGPSGLVSVFPEGAVNVITSQNRVNLPNGNYALMIPAESPERYRGKNASFAWVDELGSIRKIDAYTNLKLALRQTLPDGGAPQMLITTTPQPSTVMKTVVDNPAVRAFYAATTDNHYLHPDVLQAFIDEFGGTTLGRQELYGELLGDIAGALWTAQQIESCQMKSAPPDDTEWAWTAIGVDPAGVSESSDLTGIVVVSSTIDGGYVVRGDHSGRYTPKELYDVLCDIYESYDADGMWVETNYGGEFLKSALPTHIPAVMKNSVKGKAVRAMPVVQQYERGIVKHVPGLTDLERQMYTWSPIDKSAKSPDRLDALVMAFSWLLARTKRRVRIWC